MGLSKQILYRLYTGAYWRMLMHMHTSPSLSRSVPRRCCSSCLPLPTSPQRSPAPTSTFLFFSLGELLLYRSNGPSLLLAGFLLCSDEFDEIAFPLKFARDMCRNPISSPPLRTVPSVSSAGRRPHFSGLEAGDSLHSK